MDLDEETRAALGWGDAFEEQATHAFLAREAGLAGRRYFGTGLLERARLAEKERQEAARKRARARAARHRASDRGKALRRAREATEAFREARNAKLKSKREVTRLRKAL
jgi:hypothetical protein